MDRLILFWAAMGQQVNRGACSGSLLDSSSSVLSTYRSIQMYASELWPPKQVKVHMTVEFVSVAIMIEDQLEVWYCVWGHDNHS